MTISQFNDLLDGNKRPAAYKKVIIKHNGLKVLRQKTLDY